MLKIRPQQIDIFQPAAEASFVTRLVDRVRQKQAESLVQVASGSCKVRELPDAELRTMVERGIARARAHGMTWEKNLAKFVALMFLTAPNFDSHPLIHHILRDKQVDPESRLDRLWENISSENWSAVRQQYDISAWQLNAEER